MELKIEKGIVMPATRRKKISHIADTLKRMEIGDSFLWPTRSNGSAVYKAAAQVGIRVVRRAIGKKSRFWRVDARKK